jgi:hypothetical protein
MCSFCHTEKQRTAAHGGRLFTLILALWGVFLLAAPAEAKPQLGEVLVQVGNDHVFVSTTLIEGFPRDLVEELHNGFSKDFFFHISLYKRWSFWPDEILAVKTITRRVKYDTLKKTYRVVSTDGDHQETLTFDNFEKLKAWVSRLSQVPIASTGLLKGGEPYFVRIKGESKTSNIPFFLEYLFFFLPLSDFTTSAKQSSVFTLRER